MDSKILIKFIEEAENILPTVRGEILLSTQRDKFKNDLDISIRHIAAISNSAAAIGLYEISRNALELEKDLNFLISNKVEITEKAANGQLDKLAVLEAKISELRFGLEEFAIDVTNLLDETFDNLLSAEYRQSKLEAEAAAKLEVERDSAAFAAEVIEEDSIEDRFEDFEIDEEMLEIFALEADDHLRNINVNLVLLENDPNDREALLEIRRSSHTLKGSAGIVGLKTLSMLAHKVEDLLDFISDNEIESNVGIFYLLQSATDCISAVINNETSAELLDKIAATQSKFDTLLELLRNAEITVTQPEKSPDKHLIETEIQEVMPDSAVGEPSVNSSSAFPARSVIRVSLDKLDDLVKLVGEMVFSRSVFEQRIYDLEQQVNELQNSTRRLRHSTGKLETGFDAGTPVSNFNSGSSLRNNLNDRPPFGMSNAVSSSDEREFDSLEFDRYSEFNQTTRELVETTNDTITISAELENVHSFLEMLFDSQKHLIDEMQERLLSLRMVSFGTLASRLQRTVRVTADEEEKFVDLTIEGEGIEVDTQILDALIDPLLHLLRNAVAHGIESPETRRLIGKDERGKIDLRVYSEGTHIVLSISDNGCGIAVAALKDKAVAERILTADDIKTLTDEEALSLIFLPGLTTAEKVSQVSGRGVGMNIVKTGIERQKGTVSITSKPHKGTTFTLRLPMALAITRSLLVEADGRTFAFPLKLVKHITEITAKNLDKNKTEKNLRLGEINYRIIHLNELLGLPVHPANPHQDIPLLLFETATQAYALVVDRIIKPQEIVIKPFGNPLKNVGNYLGATLLGDGSVIPVLDLMFLFNKKASATTQIKPPEELREAALAVMIVDDSPSVRHVNSKLAKNNNWIPVIAKDGLEAFDILTNCVKLPDIILTDVEMPEMDGYELLTAIRQSEKLRRIPVVMLTSRANEKHRRKAFDLGVSEYVSKPYDDSKLVEIIRNLCA